MTASVRFYREVSVDRVSSPMPGYRVLLDNKHLKTPAGMAVILPSSALAEAVADEWRAQGEKIKRESMGLTRLVQTAIDRVSAERAQFCEQVLAFAKNDLLCYRAEAPSQLVQRQASVWDPLLEWMKIKYGATLYVTQGIRFIKQPDDAFTKIKAAISSRSDFTLVGLHSSATVTGSAVIALALAEGRIDAEQAFEAAVLDDLYQAERWGADAEAQVVQDRKCQELIRIAKFFYLLKQLAGVRMSQEIIHMNIRIEGDVQGVGFRDFAVREANARKLRGWVRNRSDGTVEVVASGPQNGVEAFIAVCMNGPRGAKVTAFNLSPVDPPDQLGFTRRPSL